MVKCRAVLYGGKIAMCDDLLDDAIMIREAFLQLLQFIVSNNLWCF